MFGKKKNEDDTEKVMKVSADNLTMITIGTIVKGILLEDYIWRER